MEQEKTNIAALLKDAPKGTKLYSPICGEVRLLQSLNEDDYIEVMDFHNEVREFFPDGRYDKYGECLLFPSKEVRDWKYFRVKYFNFTSDTNTEILAEVLEKESNAIYPMLDTNTGFYFIDSISKQLKTTDNHDVKDYILSTGTELKFVEEKQQTKFKKGDKVVILNERQTGSVPMTHIVDEEIDGIVYMDNYCYEVFVGGVALAKAKEQPKFKVGDVVKWDAEHHQKHFCYITDQVPNEFSLCIAQIKECMEDEGIIIELATLEEITKWNKEVLEPNHLHYSKSKRKIIHWFLPFDKVVMRNDDDSRIWAATFFSYYKKDVGKFVSTANKHYKQCLPYNEQTAKLIGTTSNYEEK